MWPKAAKNVDITSAVFYNLFSEVKDMVPVLKFLGAKRGIHLFLSCSYI